MSEDLALPTFFIIGAAKAGTTSLHFYLSQHPQIQMSANKEPNFFADTPNIPHPMGRVSRLEDYEQLFDPAFAVRGEASPSYTEYPRRPGVPERIRELVPQAKLIYLVRDPIERTLSHYQHSVASGYERQSLETALGELSEHSPLICQSLYARQLELYVRHFPQERIMVIDQAELLADRQSTLREIFAFLSVDQTFTSAKFNTELWRTFDRRVSPPGQERFIRHVVAPRTQWVPKRLRKSMRQSFERLFWSPPQTTTLADELRVQLEEVYAEDVDSLRTLTGKSFPNWGI